jgi:hypothetical protein
MRRVLVLAMATLTTGCIAGDTATMSMPNDFRNSPIQWTATYPGSYETLSNCIASQYAGELRVAPQDYPTVQRSSILLSSGSGADAEFQVKQLDATSSQVTWRRATGLFGSWLNDRTARQRADKCGGVTG